MENFFIISQNYLCTIRQILRYYKEEETIFIFI